MSILKLTSDTLAGTPAAGNIEYNGQFFATDSNASRAQIQRFVQETAKTASGTSVDFTGIPSWVKKITVLLNGVSLSGSSDVLIQLGDSGGIENTGYLSTSTYSTGSSSSTAGFVIRSSLSTYVISGTMSICLVSALSWVESHACTLGAGISMYGGGNKALSDTLTTVRITTVNGTDTFDAGTINIIYEG